MKENESKIFNSGCIMITKCVQVDSLRYHHMDLLTIYSQFHKVDPLRVLLSQRY